MPNTAAFAGKIDDSKSVDILLFLCIMLLEREIYDTTPKPLFIMRDFLKMNLIEHLPETGAVYAEEDKISCLVSGQDNFGTPKLIKTGGGSDAAYTVFAGVLTLCAAGGEGGKNHGMDEFAVVGSLFKRAKLWIATILQVV
jgi:hypothetical protein